MLTTYKILPPPNRGKNIVDELVPMPSVRSTSNVVNSPYTTISAGNPSDFMNVNITPRNIRNMSSALAYRYYVVAPHPKQQQKNHLKFVFASISLANCFLNYTHTTLK